MGGTKAMYEIRSDADDDFYSDADPLDDYDGLNGGDSSCSSGTWYVIIGLLLLAAAVVVVLVIVLRKKKGGSSGTGAGGSPDSNYISSGSGTLADKVVMVSWGTIEGGMESAHQGTGLLATFNGKTGVLTNHHVIESQYEAGSYAMIHVNYTGPAKMTVDQMLLCDTPCGGVKLKYQKSDGGFFYTGGQEASGYDWSFVGLDLDALHRLFPNITPYELTEANSTTGNSTTVSNLGDQVTIWHHGAGRPRREVHSTVQDDTGMQGTIAPQIGDPNKLEAGSSGSPIFKSSNMKLMGIFWGVVELPQPSGPAQELKDRFVIIDTILSQLNAQMGS